MSGVSDELQIFELFQNWQRTAANTSLKVASSLGYHSAWRIGKLSGKSALANTTTRLKRPNKQGVVRSMARSDHWRWVSKPRWARTSSKVTSMFQRAMNHWSICSAETSGSEQKTAAGLMVCLGQRTSTQRIGMGVCPRRYQSETSLVSSIVF